MKLFHSAFLGGAFAAVMWASASAPIGTINYIEGDVSLGGRAINQTSVGTAALAAGQSIATHNGKAEILLTPGIFFRLGDNSAAQMVSPGLANTALILQKGRAMVEVDHILPANNVRVNEGSTSTQLVKAGLYEFDADLGLLRVFDGEAVVQARDQQVKVKGGRELGFNSIGQLKSEKFDKKASEDDFYRWGSLRSSYISEANVDTARLYAGSGGPYLSAWAGDGWYWDPYFDAYTFLPADGIFFSPFGWGYYSPWFVYGAPYFGYAGVHRHFWPGYRPLQTPASRGVAANGHAFSVSRGTAGVIGSRGGFRGGSAGFRAGGASGFHGGGAIGHAGGGGHR
jgi:hypothetical protein